MNPESETTPNRLSAGQRAQVAGWLLDDDLTLKEAGARCAREFNVKVGKSTLGRLCQRESSKRMIQTVREATKDSVPNGENYYHAMLLTICRVGLERAQNPDSAADRRLAVDYMKILIAARRECHESLRASTIREKFEFDAATACLIHQVQMQAIAADQGLDDTQRIQKIREELFGPNLPD